MSPYRSKSVSYRLRDSDWIFVLDTTALSHVMQIQCTPARLIIIYGVGKLITTLITFYENYIVKIHNNVLFQTNYKKKLPTNNDNFWYFCYL